MIVKNPLTIGQRWFAFVVLPLLIAVFILAITAGILWFVGDPNSKIGINALLIGTGIYLASSGVHFLIKITQRKEAHNG